MSIYSILSSIPNIVFSPFIWAYQAAQSLARKIHQLVQDFFHRPSPPPSSTSPSLTSRNVTALSGSPSKEDLSSKDNEEGNPEMDHRPNTDPLTTTIGQEGVAANDLTSKPEEVKGSTDNHLQTTAAQVNKVVSDMFPDHGISSDAEDEKPGPSTAKKPELPSILEEDFVHFESGEVKRYLEAIDPKQTFSKQVSDQVGAYARPFGRAFTVGEMTNISCEQKGDYIVIRADIPIQSEGVSSEVVHTTRYLPLKEGLPIMEPAIEIPFGDWKIVKFASTFEHLYQAVEGENHPLVKLLEQAKKPLSTMTLEIIEARWSTFAIALEKACEEELNKEDPNPIVCRIVEALYKNPQKDLFASVYAILLTREGLLPNAGVEETIRALEKGKAALGFPWLTKNIKAIKGVAGHDFHPLRDGRFPYPLFRLMHNEKAIPVTSTATPTEEQWLYGKLIPTFQFYQKHILKDDKRAKLYVNLQSRLPEEGTIFNLTGFNDESRRAVPIENNPNLFEVATLSSDGNFYKQKGHWVAEKMDAEAFKRDCIAWIVAEGNGARFRIPEGVLSNEEISQLVQLLHETVYDNRQELTLEERQNFNEQIKAFITLKLIGKLDLLTYLFICCKDGIDRTGMHIFLLRLMILISQEEESNAIRWAEMLSDLHSATWLSKGQAIENGHDTPHGTVGGRRKRFLSCLQEFGFSTTELGKVEKPKVIQRLKDHPGFKELMQGF